MALALGTAFARLNAGSASVKRMFRGSAGVWNADAADWIKRVEANSGSVSTATANAVTNFCNAIDAAGIRDKCYRLNLFCGTGLNACFVPLYRGPTYGGTTYGNAIDDSKGTFVSEDYSETGASGGLGSSPNLTKHLDTGLASDTLPSILSGHLAVYMRGNAISATTGLIAADDGTDRFAIFTRPTQTIRGSWAEITNSTANNEFSFAPAYATGLYTFTRTAAAESVIYQDETPKSTNTVSTAPEAISTPWFVFAANSSGSAINLTTARLAAYSIGTGMSAANMTAYSAAMDAFQTALTRTG